MRTVRCQQRRQSHLNPAAESGVGKPLPAIRASSDNGALPAKRHFDLLQLLRRRGQITVRELSAQLQVSGDTVRRDLELLERHGLLTRTYGGAVVNENAVCGGSTRVRPVYPCNAARKLIAQTAARLIGHGETLLVNGGSISTLFGAVLAAQHVTVVTNSPALAAALPAQCGIYLLGGRYRSESQVTVGPIVLAGASITADSAVICVDGVAVEQGLSALVLEEALVASAMITAARRTILIAEASSFGRSCFAHIGPLATIDLLVTDREPSPALAQALHEAQVRVIVADAS